MAISFVGSDTVDIAGGYAITFDFAGISYQAGDFAIACVKQSENTTQRIWDDDGGGGNGWIQNDYHRTTGGRDQETAIYTKTLTASENNPTFTWWSGGTTSEPMSGTMLVYRGSNIAIMELAWQWAQNDANPPNPQVNLLSNPVSIVCFHAATHDDITAVAPPTGYTLRSQVWAGTSNDHRNHFTADLLNTSPGIGNYTPPDWQHSVANTTPEYQTYTIALYEEAIRITDAGDEQLDLGDTNELLDGFGFGASQGTGKLELCSGPDYATAVKVIQSIDSWSDDQIQYDPVFTGLSDGSKWLVVTNDNGDRSLPYKINYGVPGLDTVLQLIGFDIIHSFNNTYDDANGSFPANGQVTTQQVSFKAQSGIPGGNTHCW